MALGWPYDDRFKNFGPLQPIPSVYLNDQQDATILQLGLHFETIIGAYPQFTGVDPDPDWIPAPNLQYWECQSAGGILFVPIRKRALAAIKDGSSSIQIKYWPDTTTGPVFSLVRHDAKFGSPTTAPTLSVVASLNTGVVTADQWDVYSLNIPAEDILQIGEHWVLNVIGQPTDRYAGVQSTFSRAA
jgi:hypothetical protein